MSRQQTSASTSDMEYTLVSGRQQLLAVLEQANRIASMTSLEDLLNQMLELMIDVSGGDAGTLYLLDKEAGELVFKVVKGEKGSQGLVGQRIKQDQGIVGVSIQSISPIVIDDLAGDPRWYWEISPEETAQLKNAITLPLLLQGKPIGAVQIFNFARAELEILQLLGNRMASEVDKVLLLEKAQRSNQRLQKLVSIIGQIGATLDRDNLLSLLTENANQLLEAERSTAMLVNPLNEEMMLFSAPPSSQAKDDANGLEPETPQELQTHSFIAHSTAAVPLRARPISVGRERNTRDERVIGNLMVLNKKSGAFDSEDRQLLEILASQASTVLQIAQLYTDADQLFLDFIKVLAGAIDAKDPYTRGHSQRVSDISVAIAQQLGMSSDAIHDVRIGSLLHDIGKIGVPDTIITKPDQLTEAEFEIMKKHPAIGQRIMLPVHLLQNALPAIAEHHERLDGKGYPFGLHKDQISPIGKIVAVADVFDAMTTDRPYRKSMDIEAVFDHLYDNIDKLYDGDCVQALIKSYGA
ncbi:MAG: HD domain-containing phosphohydrolase [Chloroflexota bacterium]